MKLWLFPTVILLSAALIQHAAAAAEENTVRGFPVSTPLGTDDEVMNLAKEFADFLKTGTLLNAERNPVCCFWIEIWRPNPSESKGFLIHIESLGARLTATDAASVKEALEFLKGRATVNADGVFLPKGIFTNFDIENVNEAQPAPKPAANAPATPLMPRNDLPGLNNFAKVSDALYRGAQPTAEGFAELKKMGIKTVVNLRQFHSDRSKLKGTELQYKHLYCKAWHPEDEDVIKFLKIVHDPANQPVFVHCQHGADRTGMMAAAYRIVEQGWKPEDAARELPNFGFHTIFPQVPAYVKALASGDMKEKVEHAPAVPTESIK